jgi:hypothetical protein
VHQHCLGLVVGVVGNSHARRTYFPRYLSQKVITRLPRRNFNAHAPRFGHLSHIGSSGGYRQTPFRPDLRHETHVAGAAFSSQLVVKGCGMKPAIEP